MNLKNIILNFIAKRRIDKGQRLSDTTPQWMITFEIIEYAIEKGNVDAIEYLDIGTISESDNSKLIQLAKKAIDKGYRFYYDSPQWMRTFEVIEYAINKGDVDAFEYLDISTAPDKESLIKLAKKAIDNGYKITSSSLDFIFISEIIKYALKKSNISLTNHSEFGRDINSIVEFNIEDYKFFFNQATTNFNEEKINFYLMLLTKYNKSSEKDPEIDEQYKYLFDRTQNFMINKFKDSKDIANYLELVFKGDRNPLDFVYIQNAKDLNYVIKYTDLKTRLASDNTSKIPVEILEKANSDEIKQIISLLRNLNVSEDFIPLLVINIYLSIDIDSAKDLLTEKYKRIDADDLIRFFGDIVPANLSIKQKENGIKPQITTLLEDRIDELKKFRPEFNVNNPSFSLGLLFDDIVERYGYEFISSLLEFNSGAHLVILKANKDEHDIISKWVNYIKKLSLYNIYGAKLLHLALLSFENSNNLINNLINSDIELNDSQLQNLFVILCQRNKNNVETIDELTNYQNFRQKKLEDNIKSYSLDKVQSGIIEILFNVSLSEAYEFLNSYGLSSYLFIEILIEDGIIDSIDKTIIFLLNEIIYENDIKKLKEIYDEATVKYLNNGTKLPSLSSIIAKIKGYFGNKFKECLFKDDHVKKDGIEFKSIYGIDSEDKNIDGESITSNDTIKVVELNGIDFKLLIHKLHNYDKKFSSYADMIIDKPGLWNKLEGASTLSTSMISSKHMKCVGNGSSDAVYYGFNTISDRSLLLMGPSDIWVEHGGRLLEPTSHLNKFMDPDALQIISKHYNEVALDRKSSDSQKFDHRLQPNCIICFDGKINDASKKAAQYFKIPIYMINREKYKERNSEIYNKYVNHNIDKLDINDVKEILYSKQAELKDRYSLFLELCDYALKQNIVSFEDYIHLLKEGKKIIAYFSMHNNIGDLSIDEIENRITNIQRLLDKEKSSDGIIMEKENENKRKR